MCSDKLTDERVLVVCSPSYLQRLNSGRADEIKGCTLLHDEVLADHPKHIGWTSWLQSARVSLTNCTHQHFSHSYLAVDAATGGQGLAIARYTVISRALEDGSLVQAFPHTMASGFCYWLITSAEEPRSNAVELFASWLHHQLTMSGANKAG